MKFIEIPGKSWMRWGDRSARASRSEYWYSVLWVWILFLGLGLMVSVSETLVFLFILPVILNIPVLIRRFHDLNHSLGWIFFSFLPFGGIFLFFILMKKGTDGSNKYGEDPTSDTETKQQDAPDESSETNRL